MVAQYSPTVTCYERWGTAREQYDEERGVMSASVQLFCAYADRHRLISDLLSNHREWPKGSASLVPLAFGAGAEPFDDVGSADGQTISPATAIVTVSYSTKRVELVTEELEPVVEFVRKDYRDYTWDDVQEILDPFGNVVYDPETGDPVLTDGTPLTEDQAPAWQRRSLNLLRNEMFVNPPLPDQLFDFVGGCNNAPVYSGLLGKTFPAETLVYNPPVLHIKYNSLGDRQFDLSKRFNYFPWGANRFWNNTLGGYASIVKRGSLVRETPYPPVDFSQILAPQMPYSP